MNLPVWAWYLAAYGYALIAGNYFAYAAIRELDPLSFDKKGRKSAGKDAAQRNLLLRYSFILGTLERFMYLSCLLLGYPAFLALWLAVKFFGSRKRIRKSGVGHLAILIETSLTLTFSAAGWLVCKLGSEGNLVGAGTAAGLSLAAGIFVRLAGRTIVPAEEGKA